MVTTPDTFEPPATTAAAVNLHSVNVWFVGNAVGFVAQRHHALVSRQLVRDKVSDRPRNMKRITETLVRGSLTVGSFCVFHPAKSVKWQRFIQSGYQAWSDHQRTSTERAQLTRSCKILETWLCVNFRLSTSPQRIDLTKTIMNLERNKPHKCTRAWACPGAQ